MKQYKNIARNVFGVLIVLSFFLVSCDKENISPVPSCGVQLFDGDHFKDNYITIKGQGEYSSLKNLPNAKENWNDEADALKTGTNSTVIVWNQENYKGDSLVFSPGTEEPSLQFEMRSMKISCK